jgi:hypothetical protein
VDEAARTGSSTELTEATPPAARERAPARERTPEEIRRDIERARLELGETAAALAEKTDVKAQARAKVEELKRTVQQRREQLMGRTGGGGAARGSDGGVGAAANQLVAAARANPLPFSAAGAFAAGLAIGWLIRRRRDPSAVDY